jgi:hypothetical protein
MYWAMRIAYERVLVGALRGQVRGDTLDLRRRTGMRRVGA